MITLESTVHLPQEILFRARSEGARLLDLDSGQQFGLDEIGTRMWSLLARYGRVKSVFDTLAEEVAMAPDELEEDLLLFVEALASHELVQVYDA